MVSVTRTDIRQRIRSSSAAGALRAQLGVAGAQWIAGVGNLVFALLAARVLTPAAFAELGAFLGAYVLLHLPAAGIGAGSALAPGDHVARRRRLVWIGVAVGAAIAAAAPAAASVFSVPLPIVFALAAAAPGAALLGLERGRLFGVDDRPRIAASLVGEPLGRIGLGVVAAVAIGSTGAAIAVTAAGYVALAATRTTRFGFGSERTPVDTVAASATSTHGRTATTITFILFAVVQQQDLLFAKLRLDPEAAGVFAALSTAGGAVAFATATIPLAILPSAGRTSHTDRVAIALTAIIGVAATIVAAVGGAPLVELMFGDGYEEAASLFAPYVAGMALLGLGRVLAARRCAAGEHAAVARIIAAAVVVHIGALIAFGTSPGGVVTATVVATAIGAGAMGVDSDLLGRLRTRAADAVRRWVHARDLVALVALTTVATGIRFIFTRGLWVDEAITVSQAQLSLSGMIDQLRETDVHPPLHHLLVWIVVRIAGTGELVVRAPSIVAGALLVPVVFGLGNVLYGRRTALIAAAFTTVAPFAVWYSQEARMYSLFMVLATVSLWAQVAAIRGDGRWAWTAYAVSSAAMLWTQWFAVVPIAAQQLIFLGVFLQRRHDRSRRRRLLLVWAAALGAIVVLALPLVPIAMDQLAAYAGRSGQGAGPLGAPAQAGSAASGLAGEISVYAVGANALWAVVGYHSDQVMTQLAALWPLLLLLGLGALGRGRSNRTTALLVCIAVPALAFIAAGFFKRDLFELRYFTAVVPLVLLLVARTVTSVFRNPRSRMLASGLALGVLSVGLVDQQLNGANPRRYDFEGALDQIVEEAGPDDVVLYEPDYLADVVEYYAPGVDARPIDDRGKVDPGARTWVLATTRVADNEATSARVGDALADLEQSGRELVDEVQVPNVRVWEFQP